MKRPSGNQHSSRRGELLYLLNAARELLDEGYLAFARLVLRHFREEYAVVPASTRRRWKCGR